MGGGISQALQVSNNYRELEKKYGALTSMMSSQNQFIARLEKQCQCKDSTQQSSLVGNTNQSVHVAILCCICTKELRRVCYFCVAPHRWWLNQQKTTPACILITAQKPTKWPMMFKGTKVLLYTSRKKQGGSVPSPSLQLTLLQSLRSLVSLSQRLQVHLCQTCCFVEVLDQSQMCVYICVPIFCQGYLIA